MRITPKLTAETSCGAIAPGLAIRFACNEIMLGNIEVAVCYGAEREASIGWFKDIGSGEGSPMFEPTALQPYGSRGVMWAYACPPRVTCIRPVPPRSTSPSRRSETDGTQ